MKNESMISNTTSRLLEQCRNFSENSYSAAYPNTDTIVGILKKIRLAIFLGFFYEEPVDLSIETRLRSLLEDIYSELSDEIKTALLKAKKKQKNPLG